VVILTRAIALCICAAALFGAWYGLHTHDRYFFARLLGLFGAALPFALAPEKLLNVAHKEPRATLIAGAILLLVVVGWLFVLIFAGNIVHFIQTLPGAGKHRH
jgi:hypothetical protein